MFLKWENNSGKLEIVSVKFQNKATNDVKQISFSHVINGRISMSECKFNKLHFGIVVLL